LLLGMNEEDALATGQIGPTKPESSCDLGGTGDYAYHYRIAPLLAPQDGVVTFSEDRLLESVSVRGDWSLGTLGPHSTLDDLYRYFADIPHSDSLGLGTDDTIYGVDVPSFSATFFAADTVDSSLARVSIGKMYYCE
jgi:hypothetical protein